MMQAEFIGGSCCGGIDGGGEIPRGQKECPAEDEGAAGEMAGCDHGEVSFLNGLVVRAAVSQRRGGMTSVGMCEPG